MKRAFIIILIILISLNIIACEDQKENNHKLTKGKVNTEKYFLKKDTLLSKYYEKSLDYILVELEKYLDKGNVPREEYKVEKENVEKSPWKEIG